MDRCRIVAGEGNGGGGNYGDDGGYGGGTATPMSSTRFWTADLLLLA